MRKFLRQFQRALLPNRRASAAALLPYLPQTQTDPLDTPESSFVPGVCIRRAGANCCTSPSPCVCKKWSPNAKRCCWGVTIQWFTLRSPPSQCLRRSCINSNSLYWVEVRRVNRHKLSLLEKTDMMYIFMFQHLIVDSVCVSICLPHPVVHINRLPIPTFILSPLFFSLFTTRQIIRCKMCKSGLTLPPLLLMKVWYRCDYRMCITW